MNIVIISGSPRDQSVSQRIALHLLDRLDRAGVGQVQLIDIRKEGLPPIQAVWNKDEQVPEEKRILVQTMDQADGFILVSPEYNGGYSPAMKNFLDHFPKRIYRRKAMGIATGSTGALGGMRASQQMQLLGLGLSTLISPRMLITPHMDQKFDEAGQLLESSFDRQVDGFVSEFLWLAGQLSTS